MSNSWGLTQDDIERRKASVIEITDSDGNARRVSVAQLNEADRALAAEFGYQPVFKREFGYFAAFSFAVSISGTFATVATTFSAPLYAGGSASAVWSWAISGMGCMCIACSVSEIVSAYPTCGGLYYSVSRLAPKEWVPSISWVTGWLNLLGQVAGVASSEWGAAALLLAAVSIGSDFTYFPTNREVCGVMAALTTLTGLINSLSTKWMERITKWYVVFHVLVIVTCSIALLVKGDKHSASYVFTHVDTPSLSGWTPIGWSFLFGFLSVSWTMTDYDATAHIAEEIQDPARKAAWAISMAMLFTYVVGWLFTVVLCFTMGDASYDTGILGSTIGQPVAQIFYNVLGKSGGITFTVCAFIIIKFVTFTAMQALGRTVFAFSRDNLIPFSHLWVKIMPLTGTPILAVWVSTLCCILINLIGLGSYTAILGVFNVCAIALDWSYCIPIFCKIMFNKFEPGPWNLGRASFYVNCWACIWTFFVSIVFIMPTALPVTAINMNYAIVYLAGILGFAAIYWYLYGRQIYNGPIVEAQIDEGISNDNDMDRSSDESLRKRKVHEKDSNQIHEKDSDRVHEKDSNRVHEKDSDLGTGTRI